MRQVKKLYFQKTCHYRDCLSSISVFFFIIFLLTEKSELSAFVVLAFKVLKNYLSLPREQ